MDKGSAQSRRKQKLVIRQDLTLSDETEDDASIKTNKLKNTQNSFHAEKSPKEEPDISSDDMPMQQGILKSKRKQKHVLKYDSLSADTADDENGESKSIDEPPAMKQNSRSRAKARYKVEINSSSDSDVSNEAKDLKSKPVKDEPLGRGCRTRRKKELAEEAAKSDNVVSDEAENDETEDLKKPSEVLFEDQGVHGKVMFGFQSKKKRGSMTQRASRIINSPHIANKFGTPNSSTHSTSKLPQKTPHSVRSRMRKELAALTHENSSSGDFSDSGSDFKPDQTLSSSESEEKSQHSENETNSDSSDSEGINPAAKPKVRAQNTGRIMTRNNNDQSYVMKSDDYFSWNANSKIVTSNHTLQKLKTPKLSEDELNQLLSSCSLNKSTAHEKAVHDLFKLNSSHFNKWMYIIHEGFNILLYGLGSKREILKTFQKEMLHSSPVVVINGYFPSLTIKDIVDGILVDVLDETSGPSNVYEAVELIKDRLDRLRNIHLYLIVHNIDGPMLRNHKTQNVLSALANIANLHLLASIDHINTPLIWDHSKLSKFNFTWWDVTSFLPYSDETSFESSMLVQRSGALALSSLTNVYQSLTKNSKGVFMLIVNYQIENKSVKHYQGMPFKVLYSQCRENFLVSSDLALRAQLTEFLDHKLVKTRRSPDGTEQLVIPINNTLLQQFIEQNK